MNAAEGFSAASIAAAAIFFMIAERRWPYRNQKLLRPGFWVDMVWYNFVQSFLLALVIGRVLGWADEASGLSRQGWLIDWPFAAQLVFFIVLHDFYIYCFHRFQHHNPIFWRLHEAHHATKDVDWLSGVRSHPLEILVNQTVEYAPLILLGASPELIVCKGAIGAIWGMYIHSNLNVKMGRWQYVINGPQMHRWHHASCDPAVYNKNFATKFAFWDWLFSTAHYPTDGRKPLHYGLDDPQFPSSYLGQTLYLFRPFHPDKSSEITPTQI
jgi:sterol desaturase/sphingolipid hydroxylase (fatty acid hydroxylase superfamily)